MIDRTTVHSDRVRRIQKGDIGSGPVVYWMSREQRAHDNWPLLYAQEQALIMQKPFVVVFCFNPEEWQNNLRRSSFLLHGLHQTQETLGRHQIPLIFIQGEPVPTLSALFRDIEPAMLVTDFDPVKINSKRKKQLVKNIKVPVVEVDGHNIVPCWLASGKREYAAYTIRPKLQVLLPEFLTGFSPLRVHPFPYTDRTEWKIDVGRKLKQVKDRSVSEVTWLKPGEEAARGQLEQFIASRLEDYAHSRNNPCVRGQSDLSPYLHFGQIAPQRVALEIQKSKSNPEGTEAFLEELIIRRELADNFCFYADDYDRFSSFPEWAQKTLNEHRADPRPYLASLETLENAATSEELWNGCQRDLVRSGKLHGYLRMYWAKKILEWSSSPEEALANAIYLNDKYSLDGCDPNGYAGIGWSVGGVHDRAWPERPVFGKIRYMNQNGCKRKFNVQDYLEQVAP